MLIALTIYVCMSFPAALLFARVIGRDNNAYPSSTKGTSI